MNENHFLCLKFEILMRNITCFIVFIVFLPFYSIASEPDLRENIKTSLEKLGADKDSRIAGEKIHNIEYITNLYSKNDFKPFWRAEGAIEDAIKGISGSVDDGLLPQDYHLEAILILKNEIEINGKGAKGNRQNYADLDILVTDGVIFYANHLLHGKVDPVTEVPTWNFGFAPIPDLTPESFISYIKDHQITERLHDLRPAMPMYDTLMSLLSWYRYLARTGGWEPILPGGKIEPGTRDSRIPAIRARLQVTGDLSQPDSLYSGLYDKTLEEDVKKFQAAHALDPDGVIGAGTFRELNVPVDKRIDALRVNLERMRWVAGNLPDTYIIVNIAAFYLLMVEKGEAVFSTIVVVRKPLNKTPIFRDKLRYIEFNPTWTQPTSIVKNETIPLLKKDSTYLQKNHMILLDSKGNEVPVSMLDFKNLSASRFPYLVRQQPGPWNALGEMKFMFPNKYDIYLHDTPSKSHFSRASRAYSHGCIRVSKPKDLAVKLLEGTEYDRKKIDSIVSTHETTRVNLPEPIDILLMYWTCGIDPEGNLFFVPDIYERDFNVLKEIDKLLR